MELLAQHIGERLKTRKSCRVFETSLERVWPVSRNEEAARAERIAEIEAFAAARGWSVTIHDPGLFATFRKRG